MSPPLADASRRRLRLPFQGWRIKDIIRQRRELRKKTQQDAEAIKKAQATDGMFEPTVTIPESAEPYVVVSEAEARQTMKEMENFVYPKIMLHQKEVESKIMSVSAHSAEIVPSSSKLSSPSIMQMQTRGKRKRGPETTKVLKELQIPSTKIIDTPLANPTAPKESIGKKKLVVEKRRKIKFILDPKMTKFFEKESNHEEISQETLDHMMGMIVPEPGLQDDPIRAIMNKRAKELSSEVSREKESATDEIEAGGIIDIAPPATQIITSATDEPTTALSTEMTVEPTQLEVNPPPATVETNLDLAQSKEKTAVKTSGPSASGKKRTKYILKRNSDGTNHSMSLRIKELEDASKKSEADIMKLFGFLIAEVEKRGKLSSEVNRVMIDGSANNSRILEVMRQMTDVQDKMKVDFHMNSKEFASMKEKINDLNAHCFQQNDTRIPSCQLPADMHGEAPDKTNPQLGKIPISKIDLYMMYKKGYDDALIKLARLGYLREGVLYDKTVIYPGFERFEELRYYVMTCIGASQSTQRNMRGSSHTFEDQGRGKY